MEKKMAAEGDIGQLEQLWKWALGAIGIGGAWLWNNTMGRITSLESNKLSVADFERYTQSTEIARTEFRMAQKTLFENQERLSNALARIEGQLIRGNQPRD